MDRTLTTIALRFEHDVVLSRQRARQIAELLNFDPRDQARIATAVSEIARNAFRYAGGGKTEFFVDSDKPHSLRVRITDSGKGISNLKAVLDGEYVSRTGMGMGILGARRLMDNFQIQSGAKGTIV